MNINYKSVYNEALGAYVALSEAKSAQGKKTSNSKSSSAKVGNVKSSASKIGANSMGKIARQAAFALSTLLSLTTANYAQAKYACGPGVGLLSIACGEADDATVSGSSSLGVYNIGEAVNGSALGYSNWTHAGADNSSAVGYYNVTGDIASSSAKYSSAVGAKNTASKDYSSALGYANTSSGLNSSAVGYTNISNGQYSNAVGASNTASKDYSSALGYANTSGGLNSTAVGYKNVSSGDDSFAAGSSSSAIGISSVAIGKSATAVNNNDVALGSGSTTAAPNTGVTAMFGGTATGIANATSGVVSVGSAGKERQIQNVAAGVISGASTDAINGSQLYSVVVGVNNVGSSVASSLGGTSAYDPTTGTVTAGLTVGGNSYTNVQAALTQLNTTANAGWNVTTANTGTGTVSGTAVTKVAPGATAKWTAGNNIAITQVGTEVQIATSMTPVFTTVKAGPVLIGAAGIDMGSTKITNLTPGSAPTDGVNVSQLTSVINGLGGGSKVDPTTGAVTGPTYITYDNKGNPISNTNVGAAIDNINKFGIKYFHANSTLPDSQALGTDSVAIGPNAVANNNNDVALGAGSTTAAPNTGTTAMFGGSATGIANATSGVVSVGSAGKERQIQNVAAGVISGASTDAINGSQLYSVVQGVNTLGNTVASSLGGTSAYDPTTGTVTAGLTVGGNSYTNVQAALTQLNTTANAGWNLTAQGANSSNVAPSATVDLNNTDKNIIITKTKTSNDVTFNLATDITVDSVTAKTVTVGDTKITTDGLTIVGGPSITKAGIDAGGKTITGVNAGVNATDAVNMSQLNTVAATAAAGINMTTATVAGSTGVVTGTTVAQVASGQTATFSAGNNIVITQVGKEVQVATSMNPVFTTVTAGPVAIGAAGVDMGNTKITNLAPGSAPTDGVNLNQLTSSVAAGVATSKSYTDSQVAGGVAASNAYTDAHIAAAAAAGNAYTDAQIGALREQAFSGIAQAAAIIPLAPSVAGETTLNVGFANYGGESAGGVAISHQIGEHLNLNGGVGFGGGSNLVRVGAGWRF